MSDPITITDYADCHWCSRTGWVGPLLCTTCRQTRGQVCPPCHAHLNGPCDGCTDRVTGWEHVDYDQCNDSCAA